MAKRKTTQRSALPYVGGRRQGVVTTDPSGNPVILPLADLSTTIGGEKVTGPSSSTDNAIVRYDGTTGKLVQDSTPIVQDDGRISLVTDPTAAQDAATKAYVDALAVNLGKRARVRAATTANITIATALNNADVLDGVTLATGNYVLVKDQTAPEQNGVYVVGVTPARATEFDTYNEHPGSLIAVEEGTSNADTLWLCTSNDGGTLNTTAIAFSQLVITAGAPAGAQYVTLATDATLSAERVLTGTANEIIITDNGAGATVVLSTPQPIATGSTPQFARLGLGGAADSTAAAKITGQYYSPEVTDTVAAGAATIDWDTGTEHYLSLTANTTLTFSNPKAGGRYVLILQQDGTGSRTVTWPASVLWPSGTAPTMTATASKSDLFTFLYSGVLGKYIGNAALNF